MLAAHGGRGGHLQPPGETPLMSEVDKATADGYLYVSSDRPWPGTGTTAIADRRLPESWLEADDKRAGTSSAPTYRAALSRCRHRGRLRPRERGGSDC